MIAGIVLRHFLYMGKSILYTGTGDSGMTSLVGGTRVRKDSVRLEAYGTVDEFSSHLGLLQALPLTPQFLRDILAGVQNRLFDIGAYLATPAAEEGTAPLSPLTDADIQRIEKAIDDTDSRLEPMRCFILPGGSTESAQAHIARTVCRRAERRILTLHAQSPVDPRVLTYFNRLSDFLFAVARLYNTLAGVSDTPWQKQ